MPTLIISPPLCHQWHMEMLALMVLHLCQGGLARLTWDATCALVPGPAPHPLALIHMHIRVLKIIVAVSCTPFIHTTHIAFSTDIFLFTSRVAACCITPYIIVLFSAYILLCMS